MDHAVKFILFICLNFKSIFQYQLTLWYSDLALGKIWQDDISHYHV